MKARARIQTWSVLCRVLTLLCGWLSLAPAGAAEFDHAHTMFSEVLARHVMDGKVDYAGLKRDSSGLNRYLDGLAAVSRSTFTNWSELRQMAFLCNAYNASTLRLIVDHYPVKSIQDIGGGTNSPWDRPVVRLFGEAISLNTLERELLRKKYNEPRHHFVLVCGANGCPPLRREAYVAERFGAQLEDQGKLFLAAPDKNRFDARERVLHLSPLFEWYGEDFGKKSGSVTTALKAWWPAVSSSVLTNADVKIRFTKYDWSLNEQVK